MNIKESSTKYKFNGIEITVTRYFPSGNLRVDVSKTFGLYDSAYEFELFNLQDLSELIESLKMVEEDLVKAENVRDQK